MDKLFDITLRSGIINRMKGKIKISPSILAGDFSSLGKEIKRVEKEVDYFHIDVMDGVFVPNISIGFPVIESIKNITSVPLDVHLMIMEPDRYIERTAEIIKEGIISFHIESAKHPHRILTQIKSYTGIMTGIALNPGTPLNTIEELIDLLDVLVIMTVNPGFYGQKFIKEMLPKIERAREMIEKRGSKTLIEVDGGVNAENIEDIIKAGADIIVAGAFIFKNENPLKAIKEIREKSKIYGK